MNPMVRITITTGANYAADGSPLSPFTVARATERVREIFSREYGGYTETRAKGGWMDGEVTIEEDSIRWTALTAAVVHNVEEVARKVADLFQQECVLVEVEEVRGAFVRSTAATTEAAA